MKQRHSGFTIIEVVLVLGIAGLIFMMAFIALPSLWRSQRDAQRKANVMELISDLKVYQTNNSRGALPTGGSTDFTIKAARDQNPAEGTWMYFIKNYVAKDFADPDMDDTGSNFWFTIYKCNQSSTGATCTNTGNNTATAPAFDNKRITIYLFTAATCDGDHAVKANSERSVSAVQVLEHGGRYCHST